MSDITKVIEELASLIHNYENATSLPTRIGDRHRLEAYLLYHRDTLLSLARRAVEAEKKLREQALDSLTTDGESARNWSELSDLIDRINREVDCHKRLGYDGAIRAAHDRLIASESRVRELEAQIEKWQGDSLKFSNRNVTLSNRVRELEEANRLLAAFIAVPAKYRKDRGDFCGAECLGTCEDCVNERRRIDAMSAINANPIARAVLERKADDLAASTKRAVKDFEAGRGTVRDVGDFRT